MVLVYHEFGSWNYSRNTPINFIENFISPKTLYNQAKQVERIECFSRLILIFLYEYSLIHKRVEDFHIICCFKFTICNRKVKLNHKTWIYIKHKHTCISIWNLIFVEVEKKNEKEMLEIQKQLSKKHLFDCIINLFIIYNT